MRYDADRASQTRRRVLSEASTAIRERGPDGVSVAQVMARAGLTHGGFYAHFPSKDDLVAAAIDEMFAEARSRFLAATDGRGAEGLVRYIDGYLSRRHRDGRGSGCPLPALAAEAARLGKGARARFGAGVASLAATLAAEIGGGKAGAASVLAEMAGAVALSRAVDDPAQSDAILAASRAAVKRRLGLETPT